MKNIYVFYSLLCATRTEGSVIPAVGFEGGELSFQCSHKLAWKNNKYFCKDPCKTNEDILVTVESGGRAGAERITLVDSGNGIFYVTFTQLHLSDAGRYWCAVDRPGFDTFTEVHLTVKEAAANETTTVILDMLSSTWTYQNISSSTPLISQMDTSTNSSIASNFTDGGKNSISAGTILYASAGAVTTLIILVLAMSFRKCGKKQKQQQVCSNSTDRVGEREDPPTSASTAADCSVPFHIYENICCARDTACSSYSAGNVQDKNDASPRIYPNLLPPIISKRPGDGSPRKHTNKESCTSKVSACHSRSCHDSTESRPRSLWFGLDLSGTV